MSGKTIPAAMVAAEEAERQRFLNEERERNLRSARDAELRKQAAEVRGLCVPLSASIPVCTFFLKSVI
jgi:hypothetical protein